MKKPKRGEENQNIEDWTDTANFDQKKMSVQLYRRIKHKNFQKAYVLETQYKLAFSGSRDYCFLLLR